MSDAATQAGHILLSAWRSGQRIDALPASCRPTDREDGYAVQTAIARLAAQSLVGWKIAATSAAGQAHIGVDAPLAGPLLADRVRPMNTPIALHDNLMGVAEAEFAFRMRNDLPARGRPYSTDEVMHAVGDAFPAVEVPDSRFADFATAGAAQLIADLACASWFVLGDACPDGWRDVDLTAHAVSAWRNGERLREGSGANVLGDPRVAMTWIANELCNHGQPLTAGQIVTTGTCITPLDVSPGDHMVADFGSLGRIEVTMS